MSSAAAEACMLQVRPRRARGLPATRGAACSTQKVLMRFQDLHSKALGAADAADMYAVPAKATTD